MDKIIIQELKIETIIGCLAWERQVKQPVIIDLEIGFDAKFSAVTDDLQHTLDYCAIAQTITEFVEHSQFKLLETLGTQTAELIIKKFNVSHLVLNIKKIAAIPNAKAVSFNIKRP